MDITNELWRYPRFFSKDLTLSPEDMKHATQVLRLKKGDKLIVCDSNGKDYLCEWENNCQLSIINCQLSASEPTVCVTLFQCLPKSDKMDFIVQKAVELGVSEIVPVISKRCVSRPDEKSAVKKVERWNKIAYEAAKQCGRGKVPIVREVMDFNQAVCVNPDDLSIICYECGGLRLNDIIQLSTVNCQLLIGSEGGFEADEVELAKSHGIIPATLGKRILRVDTASIVALSLLMNLTENL